MRDGAWLTVKAFALIAVVIFGGSAILILLINKLTEPAHASGYNDGVVAGYNYGAEEGVRCGVEWVVEQIERDFGITINSRYDVRSADVIEAMKEHSFNSYPMDEYDYDRYGEFEGW